MIKTEKEKFVVSQVAAIFNEEKMLILRFADAKKWGFPGGRMDKGEAHDSEKAFLREIEEELGIRDVRFDGICYAGSFYVKNDPDRAQMVIVRMVGIGDIDKIRLSEEHDRIAWMSRDEMEKYDFLWPIAGDIIKASFDYKKFYEK